MNTNYDFAITIKPDEIAEDIALMIADEFDIRKIKPAPSRFSLIKVGLLMEIEMKDGNLGNKLLKFGDMQIAVFVSK